MSGDHPNAYKARVNKMFVLILILSLFSDEIKLEPFLLSLSFSVPWTSTLCCTWYSNTKGQQTTDVLDQVYFDRLVHVLCTLMYEIARLKGISS